jgi:release factor glutamine methyltransferase
VRHGDGPAGAPAPAHDEGPAVAEPDLLAGAEVVRWRALVAEATIALGSAIEARWLAEAAGPGSWPALLDEPATSRARTWFGRRVSRRVAGEPLQYVIGSWSFRRLDLMVDRRVLIPRPETEVVVDVALAELDRVRSMRPPGSTLVVADLGTGSGAIALSIAFERSGVEVWATDASPAALDVARANLAGVGGQAAPRVRLVEGSWWDALPTERRGRIDLVVSNPPYVTTAEMAALDPVVAEWEPHLALEAGPDGLEQVATILSGAAQWLAPGGAVVVEIAPHQAERAVELARRAGLTEVEVATDLAGRDRMVVARRRHTL